MISAAAAIARRASSIAKASAQVHVSHWRTAAPPDELARAFIAGVAWCWRITDPVIPVDLAAPFTSCQPATESGDKAATTVACGSTAMPARATVGTAIQAARQQSLPRALAVVALPHASLVTTAAGSGDSQQGEQK